MLYWAQLQVGFLVDKLFKDLVRPYLENYVEFWSSYLNKGILVIEGVQQRFTELISAMVDLSYKVRLSTLDLLKNERWHH